MKKNTKEKIANPSPVKKSEVKSAKAFARYLRVSPRKLRLVIDTIRDKPVQRAFDALSIMKQQGAQLATKLLKSAVANAKVLGLDENKLYVATIHADGGPTFKRFMSRSMGRADRILKRTSHLSIVVAEGEKLFKKPSIELEAEAEKSSAGSKKKKIKAAAKA